MKVRVINLTEKSNIYTANAFLVLGNHSAIKDINTLVDVGRDPAVIRKINEAPTGVGKKKVDQVILTHSHYDHASLLPLIQEIFDPVVYAYSPYLEGIDHLLSGGESLKIGDRIFEVIHTPGHSSDSLCLYCKQEGVLFAGDTPVLIRSADEKYEESFIEALHNLCSRNIRKIYLGHGEPITKGTKALIRASLENTKRAYCD